MAVVPRQRKNETVYYVVNTWHGKPTWERVGTIKRLAEQRDGAMKREIRENAYQPPSETKALTLRQYAKAWLAKRTNASIVTERQLFRLYVEPRAWLADKRLDEVRTSDMGRWVDELKIELNAAGGRRLSDKTIANAVGLLHRIYQSAFIEEKCLRNPVVLEPGKLKRRPAEEPETYTAAELVALTRNHAIPLPVRVLNALALFTGMREGEVCGRRWRDLGPAVGALSALTVRDQYDGLPLKTERPRIVPVHPELGAILSAWAADGFELWTGQKPSPDDFIVPNMSNRAKTRHFSRSAYYKQFVKTARAAGVRPRSLHATRHTFISLCRRGGAPEHVVERITHNAAGTIIDRYTHVDWEPLCEAVLSLRIDSHQELPQHEGNPGDSGVYEAQRLPTGAQESPGDDSGSRLRFPAPPSPTGRKQASSETRVNSGVNCIELIPELARGQAEGSGAADVDQPEHHAKAWALALAAGPLLRKGGASERARRAGGDR